MIKQETRFHLCESAEQVASMTAQRILTAAEQALSARGQFQLVLAGGRTPLRAYTLLADHFSDWDGWHIFFGDERCLAPDDPERNSHSAAQAFLDRVPIPASNVYPIPAELGAETAAARYAQLIGPRLPFDLVLLGMGEDGHTASLFPGRDIARDALVMPVDDAPKPPPQRVSLTPRALASSAELLILVTGTDKRQALADWRRGVDLPVARVAAAGRTEVLMDPDAAG